MDRNRHTISGRAAFSGIPRPGFTRQQSFGREGQSVGPKPRPNVASSGYGQYGQRQINVPGSTSQSRLSMYGRQSTHSLQPGWSAGKNLMSSARKSYASRGQGVGLFGAMTPQSSRPSLNAGTASARRSSLGGAARKLQMDPKFLEPEVQKQSIRRINDFLSSINLKLNPSFSTSEIKNLFKVLIGEFGFVLDQTETRQTIGMQKQPPPRSSDKWADDTIQFLARLGYPYQIQKSNLTSFASGSRAKAPIIASLEWVVDTHRYQMSLDPSKIMFSQFENDFELDPTIKGKTIDRDLLQLAIKLDPENDAARSQALDDLARSQYADESQLDQLRQECYNLEEDIVKQEAEMKEMKELPEAIDAIKDGISQYETYIKDMNERIESIESVIDQLKIDVSEKEESVEKLNNMKANLKNLIRNQETDIDSIEMARARLKQLEEEVKSEQRIIEIKKKEKLNAASQLAVSVGNLKRMQDDAIDFFNQVSGGMSMKATAKYLKALIDYVNSNETQFLVESLKLRPDPDSEAGLDDKAKQIRRKFVEMANRIKSELNKQSISFDGELKTEDDQLIGEAERLIEDLNSRIQESKVLVEELRTELTQQRSKHQHEIEALNSEYKNNTKFLSELDSKMKQSLGEISQRLNKLSADLESGSKTLDTYKREKNDKFKKWLDRQYAATQTICDREKAEAENYIKIKKTLENELKIQRPKVAALQAKVENYKSECENKRKKK